MVIKGGLITVNAGDDGIQSNNDEDAEKGYISIEDGTISVVAGGDGIQAETTLSISGGDISVTSGGGSNSAPYQDSQGNRGMQTTTTTSDTDSAKGLKAGVQVMITGGRIDIDSSDDAVHSNDDITISGGALTLATGDDAIHADSSLEINGGEIVITRCYEGLDSAAITINAGVIQLVATDDGVNAVTEGESSDMMGRPGQVNLGFSGSSTLSINGGTLVIDSGGDGIDINGPVTMTGGTVIINGPTNNGNGAIDYSGIFTISGGYLLAVGSSGMAMAPDSSSSQCSVMLGFSQSQPAGTLVHIETAGGDGILTFKPAKQYQSVVFSSAQLEQGAEYIVYSGGSSTGTERDGLYFGGAYTPGTEVTGFEVSGTVTTVGSSGGQIPGNMPGSMPGSMPDYMPGSIPGAAIPGSGTGAWNHSMVNSVSSRLNELLADYGPNSFNRSSPRKMDNYLQDFGSESINGYMAGPDLTNDLIPGSRPHPFMAETASAIFNDPRAESGLTGSNSPAFQRMNSYLQNLEPGMTNGHAPGSGVTSGLMPDPAFEEMTHNPAGFMPGGEQGSRSGQYR